MAEAGVLSWAQFAFLRGREAFKRGEPCPPNKWSDEQWARPLCGGQILWLGWMTERAMQMMDAEQLREWAEEDGPLPRRFKPAPTPREPGGPTQRLGPVTQRLIGVPETRQP